MPGIAGDRVPGEPEVLQRRVGQVGRCQPRQQRPGVRTLDRKIGVPVTQGNDARLEGAPVLLEPRFHHSHARGRRTQPVMGSIEAEHRQVIDHAALLVAERGVEHAAGRQFRQVVDGHMLQQGQGVGALDVDHGLVINVEHPDALTRRDMLAFDRTVVGRGGEPVSVDEHGAERRLLVVEWGLAGEVHGLLHRAFPPASWTNAPKCSRS